MGIQICEISPRQARTDISFINCHPTKVINRNDLETLPKRQIKITLSH